MGWKQVVGAVAVLALVYALVPVFRPQGAEPSPAGQDLPWQITATEAGSITVFGLTLGESTLGDAVERLGRRYEMAVFRDAGGALTLEAYFRDTLLGGLNARVVATLAAPRERLQGMLERSPGGERLAGGVERFPLAQTDAGAARPLSLESLTYIPRVRLDADLVRRRFGEPGERLDRGEASHWLYPEWGLDLLLGVDGQAVLQYVPPRDFQRLRRPLLEAVQATNG